MQTRFPPPSSLKELEVFLPEGCFNFPLHTVQRLYDITIKKEAALKAKVGPLPSIKYIALSFHYFFPLLFAPAVSHYFITIPSIYNLGPCKITKKPFKISFPIHFIILLKPCFNVIKITPTAVKAGMINQEVVCMYHNASFRH